VRWLNRAENEKKSGRIWAIIGEAGNEELWGEKGHNWNSSKLKGEKKVLPERCKHTGYRGGPRKARERTQHGEKKNKWKQRTKSNAGKKRGLRVSYHLDGVDRTNVNKGKNRETVSSVNSQYKKKREKKISILQGQRRGSTKSPILS